MRLGHLNLVATGVLEDQSSTEQADYRQITGRGFQFRMPHLHIVIQGTNTSCPARDSCKTNASIICDYGAHSLLVVRLYGQVKVLLLGRVIAD